MAKHEHNRSTGANGWDVLIRLMDTFDFFGVGAPRNIKTNITLDILVTAGFIVVVHYVVPELVKLDVQYGNYVIFSLVIWGAIQLPLLALWRCFTMLRNSQA
jgi:hypothetical protein